MVLITFCTSWGKNGLNMGWKRAENWLFWGWSLKNPVFPSNAYVCVLISVFLWVDMFVLTTLCKKLNVFYHFQHLLEAKRAENGGKNCLFWGWSSENSIFPSMGCACVVKSWFSWIDKFVLTKLCKDVDGFNHFLHLLRRKWAEYGLKMGQKLAILGPIP